MNQGKINPVVRFFPSLTDAAFLMPVFFLFWRIGGATRMIEGDTGWHIRTGEWILQNARVPDKDMFSFTKPGETWFAWEWLWDVAFAWLHLHGGMAAVVLASLFVICLTLALVFELTVRKCRNVLIAFAVTWLCVAVSSIHWWARPHVFTLLLTVIFYAILERAEAGKPRLLWLLPVLTVLWVNVHGGFMVGLTLIACYAAGHVASAILTSDSARRRAALTSLRPYVVIGAACFAATFVNPYFHGLHLHIFRSLTSSDSPLFRFVIEWQPVSFRSPVGIYFEPMVLLGLGAALWNFGRRRFTYGFLLLFWLHSALIAARNLPIFALLATPLIAEAIEAFLHRLKSAEMPGWLRRGLAAVDETSAEFGALDRIPRFHVASAGAFLFVAMLLYAPNPAESFRAEYDPKSYPVKVVDALGGKAFTGRVFTGDEWGDYLIYRLFPSTKVFVDGRFDFYGGPFTETYMNVVNARYDWDANLQLHDIDTVLLPVSSSLASTLKESARWRVGYDDGMAIVFHAAAAPARTPASSSIVSGNREVRDRVITTDRNRDPRITEYQPKKRRNSL